MLQAAKAAKAEEQKRDEGLGMGLRESDLTVYGTQTATPGQLDRHCPQARSATTRKIPGAPSAARFFKLAAAALTCSQGYANARQSAPAGRSLLQAGDVRQETAALDFGVATPAVSDGRDGTPPQALQLC